MLQSSVSVNTSVARISSIFQQGRYRISIQGALSARDLGRLERACGPALEVREMPLDIRLMRVSAIDEAAQAFLQRLAARGAIISTA